VTVSSDTQFVHLAWHREEKALKDVRYPMGADPTGAVARIFGVHDEATGLSLRGTFIVNPQGKLLSSEVAFYNAGRNVDEMVRKFKANLYLARHPDEGCPSQWRDEGDVTLKPGPELVGRVADAMKKKPAK
jgi:NADH-dependent peroxiredoxin subunit C